MCVYLRVGLKGSKPPFQARVGSRTQLCRDLRLLLGFGV